MIKRWKKKEKKKKRKALAFSTELGKSFSSLVKENIEIIDSEMEENDQELTIIEENIDGKCD